MNYFFGLLFLNYLFGLLFVGYCRLFSDYCRFCFLLSNRDICPIREFCYILDYLTLKIVKRWIDYFMANKPQIMQTLFAFICGYLLPNNSNRSFVRFNTLLKQQGRVQHSQGTARRLRRRAAGTARKELLKPEVKADHKSARAYKL